MLMARDGERGGASDYATSSRRERVNSRSYLEFASADISPSLAKMPDPRMARPVAGMVMELEVWTSISAE